MQIEKEKDKEKETERERGEEKATPYQVDALRARAALEIELIRCRPGDCSVGRGARHDAAAHVPPPANVAVLL